MAPHQQESLLTFFATMDNQGGTIVRDVPKLDLDVYISNYVGPTRYERLLLVGQCSVALSVEALKAATTEAKAGKDVQRYRDVWECIRIAAPTEPEAEWDDAWVATTEAANKQKTRELQTQLKGYKNNLVKDSIRMGHRDLGEHLQEIGDLAGATDAFVKMRADASTQSHGWEAGRHTIGVLLQKRDWTGVLASLNKIMGSGMATGEQSNAELPYHRMVSGLAQLGSQKYAEAARSFLEVGDMDICQRYNNIMSANDVATYGALLALASMDRLELQAKVLGNPSFRTFLELEPHLRRAVSMFVNGRYSACLGALESYRADYLLDIYLQKHIGAIFSMIRSKCIVQYFLPFSCVTLESMEAAFAKPGESMVEELISMIRSGVLKGRINTIDKLLVAVSTDERVAMQTKGLRTAQNYEKEALERIRRMSLVAAELEVKGQLRKGGGGAAGNIPGVGDIWADEGSSRRRMVNPSEGALG
ncbi:26S proteasome subunit RPN7-domain-containing protein [Xylariaceae sp. FL0804]|nr:26S proteasome subunit RPN7-domain-containing protein [Xylariaceae sp. FL0804]